MSMNTKPLSRIARKPDASLALRIERIMRAEKLAVTPTAEMTYLQAYIHNSERIYEEFYADASESECEDPLEKIARSEEEFIDATGRNYAGRILTSTVR